MRVLAYLGAFAVVLSSCAGTVAAPTPTPPVSASANVTFAPSLSSTPTPTRTPTPTPTPRRYGKLRVFVASESTDSVWVYEAAPSAEFTLVKKIPVARYPHQMAVSPDGKFVVVNDRLANMTSIIDPVAMTEVARLPVGRSPHGVTFSPDGKNLFIGHERDTYIQPFEVGTWKPLTRLPAEVPQHDLTMSSDRPNELWFTVTNSTQSDHLRVYDLGTNTVTRVKVQDVHDAFFTPDGSEIWSTSSGFLDKPSDRVLVIDPVAKALKAEMRLAGHYPFHTFKKWQDGMYDPTGVGLMLVSDHAGPGLLWIDWRSRRIVAETKLGPEPFHTTYDPEGGRLLVTTNVDGMVNVIDVRTRSVVQKVPVTKPHGIVSVGIP